MNCIEGITRKLNQKLNHFRGELQRKPWGKYEKLLIQQEVTWYQRARSKWLLFSDKNTKFFHASTVSKQRRNNIEKLKTKEGQWIEGNQELKEMALNYF